MAHKIVSRSKPDMETSQVLLSCAAFIGAIQQLQLGAASAVGDDLPWSLLLLQQVTPLLGYRLPTAASELTTSPSSIWMCLVMDAFQLERYKHASVLYQP